MHLNIFHSPIPSGQIRHWADPFTLVYDPSLHVIGNEDPEGQYFPIGHKLSGGLDTIEPLMQ